MAHLSAFVNGSDARAALERALGPVESDAQHQALVSSVSFPIGAAGDAFVATGTGQFHLLCGTSKVVATTAAPVFDPGVRLVLPDGCTHVAMLAAADGVAGCAYKG